MSDRRVWLAVAIVPYVVVFGAIVAGWAPIWCLGVVFAAPLGVRVARIAQRPADVRNFAEAAEFAAVFIAQVILGFVIQTITR